jgi:crotonobetainyl-CoA:carnitine CoA-transferase CaiB-like acyl-CoA transferase
VREVDEVVRDPALAERGMVTPGARLAGGETTDLFALPWRIEAARPPVHLPPPRLGEHTEAFRQRFGAE